MNKRNFVSFPLATVQEAQQVKKQVLIWLRRFSTCCFLDNSDYASPDSRFECLAAAGELAQVTLQAGNAFESLRRFSGRQNDWMFGHFSFALKSETDAVPDRLRSGMSVPDGYFFVPDIVVKINQTHLHIGCVEGENPDPRRQHSIYREMLQAESPAPGPRSPVLIRERMTREEYVAVIRKLLGHIQRGDCYEINYCQEFFATAATIDPFHVFEQLSGVSPAPFAAFYRLGEKFLLCASPERYLRREGRRVFSQPIKGTSARFPANRGQDERSKASLAASIKDQTENVMIADLVRNDLSRFCVPDSVRVDELFGIYSFAQVHQMITTVSGEVPAGLDWTEMIRKSFPMGSMTGAPKKRVLELIGQYEKSGRGLFSGALGYVDPERDFDFNVIIRSLLYDRTTGYLGWFAGSGITAASDPDAEYEECLVKVAAIRQLLSSNPPGAVSW